MESNNNNARTTSSSNTFETRPLIFLDSSNPTQPNQVLTSSDSKIPLKPPFPPVLDPDCLFTRRRSAGDKSPTKPANAFIIYRRAFIKAARTEGFKLPMTVVSTMASQAWDQEPGFVKEEYRRLAKEAKSQHEALYPKPNKETKKSRAANRKLKKAPREDEKDTIVEEEEEEEEEVLSLPSPPSSPNESTDSETQSLPSPPAPLSISLPSPEPFEFGSSMLDFVDFSNPSLQFDHSFAPTDVPESFGPLAQEENFTFGFENILGTSEFINNLPVDRSDLACSIPEQFDQQSLNFTLEECLALPRYEFDFSTIL